VLDEGRRPRPAAARLLDPSELGGLLRDRARGDPAAWVRLAALAALSVHGDPDVGPLALRSAAHVGGECRRGFLQKLRLVPARQYTYV
jgi:hypothetical protein